jgi:hypothetical protein
MAGFYERTYTEFEILKMYDDFMKEHLACDEVMDSSWFVAEKDSSPAQRPNTPSSAVELRELILQIGYLVDEAEVEIPSSL